MTQKTKRNQAFRKVLGFTARHWRKQPVRIATIVGLFFIETITDILTPFFAGRLVEAVASGAASSEIAWNAAITAFLAIVALGAASVLVRLFAFRAIIQLTLQDDERHRAAGVPPRAALQLGLARQLVRRLDGAQDQRAACGRSIRSTT